MQVLNAKRLGVVFLTFLLGGCGGGGGGGGGSSSLPASSAVASGATLAAAPTATPAAAALTGAASNLAGVSDFQAVASALATSQRADGAIPYTSTFVSPYFANIAATGAARTGSDLALVRKYIAWYILRSHDSNPWGIAGAITDYTILANGMLQSAGNADSVDSYAATFLTLVSAAYQNGDATTRSYVQSIQTDVERIASSIDAVTDTDGLTWALPAYHVKYVMDASEVYAGYNDLATLRSSAYGNAAGALTASQRAAALRAALIAAFWSDARGTFAVGMDASGSLTLPDPASWSDAMSQLAPILHGVIAPSSSTAVNLYAAFNAGFPAWTSLVKADQYPWVSVAYVALLMNDSSRAGAYRGAAVARYTPQFAYPWYCAESGWFLRLVDGIVAPQTVAAD
jgi:hypothetical protein